MPHKHKSTIISLNTALCIFNRIQLPQKVFLASGIFSLQMKTNILHVINFHLNLSGLVDEAILDKIYISLTV